MTITEQASNSVKHLQKLFYKTSPILSSNLPEASVKGVYTTAAEASDATSGDEACWDDG